MRELKSYELNLERQRLQRAFADTYRLAQSIEEHNRQTFDWRNLLKPFNRSHR